MPRPPAPISVLSAALLALSACARDLAVVDDDTGADDDAVSDDDTGPPADDDTYVADDEPFRPSDDDSFTGPPEPEAPGECADGWLPGEPGPGDLVLDGCARVSPEVVPDAPAPEAVDGPGGSEGPPGPGSQGPGSLPEPCGFYNMIGAVGVVPGEAGPALLYCDSDLDGGVRFLDRGAGPADARLVEPGVCDPGTDTGGLAADGDGWIALWIGYPPDPSVSDAFTVVTARLGADGTPESAAAALDVSVDPRMALLVSAFPPRAVVTDWEGVASLVEFEPGAPTPATVRTLAAGIELLSAAERGDGLVLAACDAGFDVVALAVSAAGEVEWEAMVQEGGCDLAPPPVAVGDGGIAVGWDDGSSGGIVFLDGEGAETGRAEQGEVRQVVWTAGAFTVVSRDGRVAAWSAEGILLGEAFHPYIAHQASEVARLWLAPRDGTLDFVQMGIRTQLVGPHAWTSSYLERSSAPW